MTAVQFVEETLPAIEIGRLTLRGDLVIWRGLSALRELCAMADDMLRRGLQDGDPQTAETRLDPQVFLSRVRALRLRFRQEPAIADLFKRALLEAGLSAFDTYWDALQFRIVPSFPSHQARRIMPLPPHRDNWGSNIGQQINWWTPLYPVAANRTIVFYPGYWSKPVRNNSADWDFAVLKRLIDEGKADAYPVLPTIAEELPRSAGLPMVLQPGDMLAFSGQHLHGSVASDPGNARFSAECRTVSLSHVSAGLCAPNVDGRAPRVVPEWFLHMEDRSPLTDAYESIDPRLCPGGSAACTPST